MRSAPLLLTLAVLVGCASPPPIDGKLDEVLSAADRFQLYALHPDPADTAQGDRFYGYRILGQASIGSPAEQSELINALYDGIRTSDGKAAACFNPRHGIRAVKGGTAVDLVICFECLTVQIYRSLSDVPPPAKAEDAPPGSTQNTTGAPKLIFDAALTRNGLPRADQ